MTREEAIEILCEYGTLFPSDKIEAIDKAVEALKDRPKGEWMFHEDYRLDGECCYECSNCGRMYDYKMNYCGYCGSDNRGRRERE